MQLTIQVLLSADEGGLCRGREGKSKRMKLEAAAVTLQVGTPQSRSLLTSKMDFCVCGLVDKPDKPGGRRGGVCGGLVPNSNRDRIEYCGGWVVENGPCTVPTRLLF